MAAKPSDSQTLTFLDTSQLSTPPPVDKSRQLSHGEVIEDSLKDNPDVYQGGAVQKPGAPPPNDEDDLYSESPETKDRRIERDVLSRSVVAGRTATVRDDPSMIATRKEQAAGYPVDYDDEQHTAQAASHKSQPSRPAFPANEESAYCCRHL